MARFDATARRLNNGLFRSAGKALSGRARRISGYKGFTLIELLVVVVIIGILIAIAIPLYLNYRKGANDRAAQSDLRNAISVLELCSGDTALYPATVTAGTTGGACTNGTINVSGGTSFSYFPVSSTDLSGYIMSSTNSRGSAKIYCYNSTKGGAVKDTAAAVTTYRSAC